MRLRIRHETVYEYAEPAFDSHNEVRLQPLDDDLQRRLGFKLTVEPPARLRSRQDYFGNTVHYFSIPGYHARLSILAESLVLTFLAAVVGPPRDRRLPLDQLDDEAVRAPLVEYLMPSRYVPLPDEIQRMAGALADAARGDGARYWDGLLRYMQQHLTYETGSTTVEDDALKVLQHRRGVCQDFAHVAIALARGAGVPARYVSGYVKPFEGPGVDSHAWAELYLPGAGWVGLDASGPGPIDDRYVRVAYGLDYADANPLRGRFSGGGSQQLAVSVQVQQAQQQ
jgi:transglutaminase-like putative cysteine protease